MVAAVVVAKMIWKDCQIDRVLLPLVPQIVGRFTPDRPMMSPQNGWTFEKFQTEGTLGVLRRDVPRTSPLRERREGA